MRRLTASLHQKNLNATLRMVKSWALEIFGQRRWFVQAYFADRQYYGEPVPAVRRKADPAKKIAVQTIEA